MSLIIIAVLLVILFIVLVIFTSPSLSPVPYFPTNHKDLHLILNALELKNDQIVFDLGAGDGIVLIEAAKKAHKLGLNTKFYGVEINPILVFIIQMRLWANPQLHNVRIVWGDMFKLDYQKFLKESTVQTVFYLYISPWLLEKVYKRILSTTPIKKKIVSYMYYIKPLESIEKSIRGLHKVFIYDLYI